LLSPSVAAMLAHLDRSRVDARMIVTLKGWWDWTPRVSPESEMERVRDYYLKTYQLPVVLGTDAPTIESRPDGRLVVHRTATEVAYGVTSTPTVAVVDRQGHVRLVTAWEPTRAASVAALISSLLIS
jgi:hypothetical protein